MRADERTRTADLLITSEKKGVAGAAGGCETPIPKPFSLLPLARCCTMLCPRWCQSDGETARMAGEPERSQPLGAPRKGPPPLVGLLRIASIP